MYLLVKFLDEVDSPYGVPPYGSRDHRSDEVTLKVSSSCVLSVSMYCTKMRVHARCHH